MSARRLGRRAAPLTALALAAASVAVAQEAPDEGPIRGRSGLDQLPAAQAAEAPRPAPRPAPAPAVPAPLGDAQTPELPAPAAEPTVEPTRPDPAPAAASAARTPALAPASFGPATLYPRLLPAADRHGEAFADRVSISPDGRRLAVGSQNGGRFEVQVVGVSRKVTERALRGRGTLDWVAWADDGTVLVGSRGRGGASVAAYDVASGKARVLGTRRDSEALGVLSVLPGGRVVLAEPGRTALACANGAAPPRDAGGVPLRVAGPPDAGGRLILRGEAAGRGVVVPFDCDAASVGDALHEGAAPTGLIVNPTLRRYDGVWTEGGPRYFDRSLGFEMREVAASFPEPVDVYPIETTRSPNTLLLYVVGERVPGGYYVLDRYAGDLDLHVTYRQGEAETSAP